MLVNVSSKLKNKIVTKILVDNYNGHLHEQIQVLNRKNVSSLIDVGYSNRLGKFDEMIICFDEKYVLQIQQDQSNEFIGSFTNDSNKVLVQQILFEKCWNEVKSLQIRNTRS